MARPRAAKTVAAEDTQHLFPVTAQERADLSEKLVEAEVDLMDTLAKKRAAMAEYNQDIKGTRENISKYAKALARKP